MPQQEMFRLENVSKSYGGRTALSSLSFHILKGESVALVGPSGAGKTTLLNILARQVIQDQGKVFIDSIPASQFKTGKELARKVGMMHQQFDLVGQLPVIHNVLAGRLGEWGIAKSLISLIVPQERELAVEALKKVGLQEKLYEKTANLSGGEQQRVALARLLVQNPMAILADEPVASLDPARAEDILSMLTHLARVEGKTLVASLHTVDYAQTFFNRMIALRAGKVFFDRAVGEVSQQDLGELYHLMEQDQESMGQDLDQDVKKQGKSEGQNKTALTHKNSWQRNEREKWRY